MRRLCCALFLVAMPLTSYADVIPPSACGDKAAGDACTEDGGEGTCVAVKAQSRGPLKLAKEPPARLACVVTKRAKRADRKPLFIAAGCAIAAVAVVIAGRGWTKGATKGATNEAPKA
ncbi:MAG TPA: hypothetical protein VM052_07390 [Candidatus Limnocylindrales bacterium]|nr:hypothetical protein [Candidatus Limnocylindrales bacterium]